MRILITSEPFLPNISGAILMAERLAAAMAERGHTVAVITASLSRSYGKEEQKGYTIFRIPSWPNPLRQNFRFTLLPFRYIKTVCGEFQPDLIHAHDPATISQTTAAWARHHHIPVVATNHFAFDYIDTYLHWLGPLRLLVSFLLKRWVFHFYNNCTVLTVPTETVKQQLKDRYLYTPIEVISNGVDISRFAQHYKPSELLKRYQLDLKQPILVTIGRLDPEKNTALLLDALAALKEPAQLVIVGRGNLEAELKDKADKLHISKKITWIPYLDSRSTLLNQLYQLATLFCIPSRTETESLVTMEAMASGLPILASRVGALPELVRDGENGFLFPPDDPTAWSTALEKILHNPELIRSMGRASLERIAARDLPKTLDRFETLYQSVITKRHSPDHPA